MTVDNLCDVDRVVTRPRRRSGTPAFAGMTDLEAGMEPLPGSIGRQSCASVIARFCQTRAA
ncbi:hypothetical protein GCM10022253_06470 [Sphingomonas endophytica]|uniref:Uncharacterized protein n=1 Tax=Sphingomonas endophytica TaxID=869719 RepID=A0ABR6N0M0_9SPHN|nr:hypothetical protein [Sphingomonas endophytica]MBB5724338.1 hypothetical protein [Sphingomonas endophytica]